jgi:HAD superfamily hydrolase (TIGR01509 family)
LEVVESR